MRPKDSSGGQVLPVLQLEGTAYFVDLRLRQFREPLNPHAYVDFDSVDGKRLCWLAGVVTCLQCGASVIVSRALREDALRCIRCGSRLEP